MITSWGTAIINAFANALNLVLTFIPKLIGFLVILLVGWIVATVVSKALTFLLRKVGFDRMANRIGLTRFEQRMGITLDPAGLLGKIFYWFLVLIFLVPAVDALGLTTVSAILGGVIAYIPNVFVAILVLFLGTLLATFVADIVRGATATANVGNPNIFANIARYSIMGFAALVALEQLQIAQPLIIELFGAIVAAAALAFGLAFGLGGRETAQRYLNRAENTVGNAASQISAQQSMNAVNTNAQLQADQMRARQMNAYQQQYDEMPTQQQVPPPTYPQQVPTQEQNPYPPQQPPYTRQ